ncbi:MAG: sugar phosphate isomerase/epimerase [Bacteroidales bacterium]
MKNIKNEKSFSRREFLGTTAAAASVFFIPSLFGSEGVQAKQKIVKPNSNFGGVRTGAITYSWRSMPGGVENIIKYCQESGISNIELMSNDLESFLGAPQNPMAGMMRPPAPQQQPGQPRQPGQQGQPGGQPGGQRPQRTPEQEAAIAKYNEELKKWRTSLPMSKVEQARKLFDDAGISVHIVKFSPSRWSDEEIDYAFRVAKAMGAKGVTDEIGEEAVKRLAPFAEKHGMYAIFHNHMQFGTPGFSYDPFLAVSPAVMMNFDAGHFFGSTGIHPNEILQKYHDRIFSVHMKDKTGPKSTPPNTNMEWGKGETPIADVLLLIKKQKWPIHVDIELEYPVPEGSDAVKETKKCVEFMRKILA